ncbi:MAG: hypothetical protein ACO2OW_00155 [Minisyncoccia bacterium]|jgi:hypothetical protein
MGEWIGRPEPSPQPQQESGPSHIEAIVQELAKARTAIAMLLQQLQNYPDLKERYTHDLQMISAFASDFIDMSGVRGPWPSTEEIEKEIRENRIILEREEIGILGLLRYIRSCLLNVNLNKSYLNVGTTLRNMLEKPQKGKPLQEFIKFLNDLIKSIENPQ